MSVCVCVCVCVVCLCVCECVCILSLSVSLPELLLYLIVGGVLAGVVLVAVLLFLICCVGLYIRRQHQGGKISEWHHRLYTLMGLATLYKLFRHPPYGHVIKLRPASPGF